MAEPELSALTRQCLRRRISAMACIAAQAGKWAQDRNALQTGIDWHFRTEDALIKLKYIYPKVLG